MPTNYTIFEDGRLFNTKTNKFLSGQISNSGYLTYNITLSDGSKVRLYAHRMVAEMYLDNSEQKAQVNHKDGNKLNNNLSNLEWNSSKENIQHAVKSGLIETKMIYCFGPDKQLVQVYNYIQDIPFNHGEIRKQCLAPVKVLTNGYYWSYDNENTFEIFTTVNTGKARTIAQCSLDGEVLEEFNSISEACRKYNFTSKRISAVCNGREKSHKGFFWKYI
jgi:hypothetical protein